MIQNAQANEIGTVLQKGYTLNSRLLRPAMVMGRRLSQINSEVCEIFQKF